MGIRDAKRVWDTLKGIHQTGDHARVQSLLSQFIRIQVVTTIDDTTSTLTRLQSEIGNLDNASKPSDAIKIETLLSGLGLEYESTLAALEVSNTVSFEGIISKLRKTEARLKGQGITLDSQNLARRTNTSGYDSSRTKKKGACFHCGKPGHFKRDCRKLLAEQKSNEGNSALAVTDSNELGMTERAWATTQCQIRTVTNRNKALQTDPWYLDSAATSHMTNCRDLFVSYRQVKDTVTVVDGRQLTSNDQGTVRVQFRGKWVQIHQVLYIPGLQGNLLSVG